MPKHRVYLTITTVGIAAFYLLTIRSGHSWGDDFVQYLQHAANLAANEPYANQLLIVNPSLSVGPPAYPPVFPLMLLPVLQVFGLNFAVLKVFMGVLFGLAVLSIGLAFDEALPGRRIVPLLLLLALAPTFWTFKEAICSDVPFLIFCFLSLALIQKMVSTPSGRELYLLSLLTGVVIYLACGTRSQGLPLVPTLLIADFLKAKRVRLAPVLTCCLVALLLFVQNRLVFIEGERLQYLTLDPSVVWSNVTHYAGSLSTYWDNGYAHSLRYLCFLVALVLGFVGYAARVVRGPGAFEVFPPLFVLPLFFWTFQQGIRYLLPIIPLYVFYVMEGVRVVSSRFRPEVRRVLPWAFFAAALGCFASMYTTVELGHIDGPLDAKAQEMLAYVETESGPSDVFLFEKPRLVGLLAHRKAAIPTRVEDPRDDESALQFYRSIGATYVITTNSLPSDQEYLKPFLSRNPDWAREAWSNDAFQLWEVRDE